MNEQAWIEEAELLRNGTNVPFHYIMRGEERRREESKGTQGLSDLLY
jgi:hypothetical protein